MDDAGGRDGVSRSRDTAERSKKRLRWLGHYPRDTQVDIIRGYRIVSRQNMGDNGPVGLSDVTRRAREGDLVSVVGGVFGFAVTSPEKEFPVLQELVPCERQAARRYASAVEGRAAVRIENLNTRFSG